MSLRFRVAAAYPLSSSSKPYSSSSYSSQTKQKKNKERKPPNPILRSHLTHDLLRSSDLLSLSCFLWCARQPHFFHDRPSFLRMFDVVSRLHRLHGGFPGLLHQLSRIGSPIKPQTFLLLIRICWVGGSYDLVLDVFDQMETHGFSLNTFALNVQIDVLFRVGRPDHALRVLRGSPAPNFLSFNIALGHLCRSNDAAGCLYVLSGMSRNCFYPDPRAFELVLDVLCKNSRIAQACQVLGLMIKLGVPFSVLVWSILIDGFCRTKRLQMAFFLLENMIRAGCSPTVVTYTSLVKALMESDRVDDAVPILGYMEAEGCVPDLILCNVLMHGLVKNGMYVDAIEVFSSMADTGLVPDPYTFSSLFSAICSSRKFHCLPKLVGNHVINADRRVFNSMLTCFCKANLPSLAVRLYGKMIMGLTPVKFSFVGLLNGLRGSGDSEEVFNVYSNILTSHSVLDTHAHTVVMQALIQSGKFDEAMHLFRQAEKSTLDSISYAAAMRGLFKGGRHREVAALYNQMKELDITPCLHAYHVMTFGYCKIKDEKMATQILQDMVDAGFDLSSDEVGKLFERLKVFRSFRSGISSDSGTC